jgi:large subunit ribosomal protein L19
MNIIEQIEKEQLRDDIPEFSPGDTVAVQVRIKEGTRERLERVFQTHSKLMT